LYLIEGQIDVAFIDVDSLEANGIAIPSGATPRLNLVVAADESNSSENDEISSTYLC